MPRNRKTRISAGLSGLSESELGFATMIAAPDARIEASNVVADQAQEPHCNGFACGTMRACAVLCSPMSCSDFVGPNCRVVNIMAGCPILIKCEPMSCGRVACNSNMLQCTLEG